MEFLLSVAQQFILTCTCKIPIIYFTSGKAKDYVF